MEKERVLIVHQRGSSLRRWCARCAAEAAMLEVEEAAAVVGATPGAIEGWVETERLHHSETPDGSVMVCLNSLLQLI